MSESAPTSKVIFLDTNSLLHYKFIDQVDWPSVVAADEVLIVLAPVVLGQLNSVKDTPRAPRKLRERASSVLKRLYGFYEKARQEPEGFIASVRHAVSLLMLAHEPTLDFAALKLDSACGDDRLLASLIEYATEHPEPRPSLLTHDLGLTLKAGIHNVETCQLPADYGLPDEPDADEIRLRELEDELRKMKHRVPRLSLAFAGGGEHKTFRVRQPKEIDRDAVVKRVMDAHPKISLDRASTPRAADAMRAINQAIRNPFGGISREQIEQYNRELDAFYGEWHLYLMDQAKRGHNVRVELRIMIFNSGTCPAHNVRVRMLFPDGLVLCDEESVPSPPPEPKPPARPQTQTEQLHQLLCGPTAAIMRFQPIPELSHLIRRNVTAPRIRRTDSYEAEFEVENLQHHDHEELDAMYVVYESFDEARSFGIEYELIADEKPSPDKGRLDVVIDKV